MQCGIDPVDFAAQLKKRAFLVTSWFSYGVTREAILLVRDAMEIKENIDSMSRCP